MIISCPKCQTQYNIGEQQIPAEGKKFRCAHCGNVWLVFPQTVQQPIVEEPAPISVAPSVPVEPAPIPDPVPAPEPEIEKAQEPEPEREPEQPSAETTEQPKEEEKFEKEDNDANTPLEMTEDATSEASSDDVPFDEDTASDASFDEIIEKTQEASESLDGEETSENTEEEIPSDASSEYHEGEEIPDQFKEIKTTSSYRMEDFSNQEEKKSALIPFLFLVVSFLIAGYIGRFYLVDKYPPLQSTLESIGISFDILGDGLAFQDIKKDIFVVDDINYLVVKGSLINESNKTRQVPNITLYLYDTAGKLIQWTTIKPEVSSLTPGETAEFLINIEAPSVVATEAKVTFSESKGKRR